MQTLVHLKGLNWRKQISKKCPGASLFFSKIAANVKLLRFGFDLDHIGMCFDDRSLIKLWLEFASMTFFKFAQ